jgi:Ca2+-binding EF-hand superfamily protein
MTRTTLPALGLVALLAGALLAADAPAPAAGSSDTTQELLFFTADGPVRVRLTLTVDGKPAEDAWRAALDGLFAFCDKNGDGALESSERGLFANNVRRGQRFVVIDGLAYAQGQPPQVSFTETNGKVDREAFRNGFRGAGLGPVTVAPVLPRTDSKALTDALFKHLDTDGDGKLSLDELRAARTRLAVLDVDEDETITSDELLARNRNNGFYGQVAFASGSRPREQPRLTDVLIPSAGQAITVKDLLAARDKDKDGALSAAEFGGPAEAFAELDADGDGRLDADELSAWLRRPPDLDLKLDLGDSAAARDIRSFFGEGMGAPVVARGRLAARSKPEWAGGLKLDLRDARFRFAREDDAGMSGRQGWVNSTAMLRQAFESLAGEKRVVGRKQLTDNPEYAGALPLFDFADRDKDGRVTKAELDAVIRVGDPLANCRVVVSVTDRGRGLFELLDRDGDGRLSPRELSAAAAVLADLDRDGDGKLSRDELPRGWTVTAKATAVEVISAGFGGDFEGFVILDEGYGARAVTVRSLPSGVPEWFRHMDRNGDGDVSAREFTGPPWLFKKIDTDGDGLISPAEAAAYERAARKGK